MQQKPVSESHVAWLVVKWILLILFVIPFLLGLLYGIVRFLVYLLSGGNV